MASYSKDYTTILNEILTDYSNLDEAPDTSVGTMTFIFASVLASIAWGLYRFLDWISKQLFVDICSSDNLKKWGAIYGITYTEDDTDATYLNKVLSRLRQAPAGGNKLDFETWALDSTKCYYVDGDDTLYNAYVNVIEGVDGVDGTVGVYTIINDETLVGEAEEEALRSATENYIESVRPLGLISVTVDSASKTDQAIEIEVVSPETADFSTDDIETAIEDYINILKPGQALYTAKLEAICLDYGAINATVTTPASDVTVDPDEYIRPDGVTITEA